MAQKMSTVIFSLSFLILLALIYAALLRRRREQHSFLPDAESLQIKAPRAVALFAPTAQDLSRIEREKHHRKLEEQREMLLSWATLVDFAALENRPIVENEKLLTKSWAEAVEILTERAASEQDVRRLASFCLDHEFNVNKSLINAFHKIWAASPDRRTTAEMFRIAAQNDEADTFLDVLTEAEQAVQKGRLSEVSAAEIYKLAESHYWLLPESARTSGAGFLIKEKMADLRRALTHNQ